MYKVLRFFPLFFILIISLTGCGEFTTEKNDVKTGKVSEVHISISEDKLQHFYNSVSTDNYTWCMIEKDSWHGDVEIKVRGDSSRMRRKKSFALKVNGKKYMLERGQQNGGIYNRIAMRAYQLAGVTACDTESVALFLNDEYLGCYNFIIYYDPDTMDGELYKCWFSAISNMGSNHPLSSQSEKKFPKDDDMSNLDYLVYACSSLSDEDWREFVNKHMDINRTAAYMVVHDFLTVTDTSRTNYYIHFDGKYRIVPWDNEMCMLKDRSEYALCTDNQLVNRLGIVPEFKTAYNQKMQELFTGGGATCILDSLSAEASAMFDNLCTAMESDPVYRMSRQQFMAEKAYVLKYLDKNSGRAAEADKLILH